MEDEPLTGHKGDWDEEDEIIGDGEELDDDDEVDIDEDEDLL